MLTIPATAILAMAAGGGALTTSLRNGTVLHPGEVIEFTVRSTLPNSSSARLALLNPPPGCVFTQDLQGTRAGLGKVTSGTGRWMVPGNFGGIHRLSFRAIDAANPTRTAFTNVDVRVDGVSVNSPLQIGDVTGDGVLDTVAGASFADVNGVTNAGAIYVWHGKTSPSGTPDATLVVAGATASDLLGQVYSSGFVHTFYGQGIQLADVTGDGVLDVVARAGLVDVAGVKDAGAVYVWRGGSTLAGTPAPLATLTVPGAVAKDNLGNTGSNQGIQCADVTNDGVLDVVAGAEYADVAGTLNAGAVYVWKGGATLSGSPTPLATLSVPTGPGAGLLGLASGQGIQLADVTADGVLDVVAGAAYSGVAGVSSGAIHVWSGGPTLTGSPAPLATLYVPGAVNGDYLGIASGQGIQLADVTADGVLDVVAGAQYADVAGVKDAGAIYVWKGGPTLTGSVAPLATLTVPGAVASDSLGYSTGQGVQLFDVTGEGVLDVVAGAQFADVTGVLNAGAVYVWKGGWTLSGTPAPLATLTVAGVVAYDSLGSTSYGQGVQIADVTSDGVLDVVACAPNADVAGVINVGAIYVWKGGATLTGSPAPLATLVVAGAVRYDSLGYSSYAQGVQLADVTHDGVLDLVVGAESADVGTVYDAGAIYVWRGGPTLTGSPAPLATLTDPGARQYDRLGYVEGQGIQIGDVTGDGVLDVIAGSMRSTAGGVWNAGAIFVWSGGSALSGSIAPLATLAVSSAVAYDHLGYGDGVAIQLADVTGDAILDVVANTIDADVGGVTDAGAVYVWSGGRTLTGNPAVLATLTVSGAVASDRLGVSRGAQGVCLADITGDGVLDVVAETFVADVAGVVDAGAIYSWAGGLALNGSPALLSTMAVAGATAFDQLGY